MNNKRLIAGFDRVTDRWLMDQHHQISYADIGSFLNKIDQFFNLQKADHLHGRFLFLCKNTVLDVLVLLYLMQSNRSFFLVNGNHIQQARRRITFGFDHTIETMIHEKEVLDPSKQLKLRVCAQKQSSGETKNGQILFQSSGTLSNGKIIVHSVDNLIRNAALALDRLKIDEKDRVIVPVPISHMYGFGAALIPSLLATATLHLVNNASVLTLFQEEARSTPTIGFYTPSLLNMYKQLKRNSYRYSKLISAGDRLNQSIADFISEKYGTLINLYGSTEMGVIATSLGNSPVRSALSPLEGVKMDFSVMEGDLCEINCRHPFPFVGYLDETINTLATFDNHSYYPTKDIGKVDEAGKFSVLGRSDLCISRRGVLISLVEVEHDLRQCVSEIDQVIVVAGEEDDLQGVKLIACYTTKNSEINTIQIGQLATKYLEKYKTPDVYIQLEHMPVLSSGKIDRKSVCMDILN